MNAVGRLQSSGVSSRIRIARPYAAPWTMSSVPLGLPDTIKKVAATSGHKVRRTNFFRLGATLGTTARGWGVSVCCGALAVANFYVFLLKRLPLSYSAAGWCLLELSGLFRFQKFRWS